MNNRYVQQFKKGSLEMILLCLIGRKETYGYEIISELNNSASVLGYAKEGTIYPILYDKGRNVLDELILFWSSYENCVNGFIESYQQARVSK